MPNIFMIHRVHKTAHKNPYYAQRNMTISLELLLKNIQNLINNGKKPASLTDAINDEKCFFLSFDDGFKEHLELAVLLKNKLNLPKNSVCFCVNVGNSVRHIHSGMDLVYELFLQNKQDKLSAYLHTSTRLEDIKQSISSLNESQILELNNKFKNELKNLKNEFLNKKEIKKLSKIFNIASHGEYHRFLTTNQQESAKEIANSKQVLENLTQEEVSIFCYPEGKNNQQTQDFCKNFGYKFALSIRAETNNLFCIPRKEFLCKTK